MSDLTTGGSESGLPEGWDAPVGWADGLAKEGAYWMGLLGPTDADMEALSASGWTADEGTLCGRQAREWGSEYHDRQRARGYPVPGGIGSVTYEMQHIPYGFDGVAKEHVWLHYDEDGRPRAVRSVGGELFHRVEKGAGHTDLHLGPRPGSPGEQYWIDGYQTALWDADAGLYWLIDDEGALDYTRA